VRLARRGADGTICANRFRTGVHENRSGVKIPLEN
jgi:hypothetical protein